jgi:hypothetical protein
MRTSAAFRLAQQYRKDFEAMCEQRICAHCQLPFLVANKKSMRRYCNQRCNNAAYLLRRASSHQSGASDV